MTEEQKEHHEHKEHYDGKHHPEHKKMRIKKLVIWQLAAGVLGILLIISIFTNGFNITKGLGSGLTAEQAADKAVAYINNNLLQPGTTATLKYVEDKGDLYNVKLSIGGRDYDSYITKDGSLLFPSAVELTETVETLPTPQEVQRVDVSADDDASKGPKDAKVTIIEFSDFQCPFCARVVPTIKQIIEEYGDKVRVVYRDYPLSFHQDAQKAAEAAECAHEQDKFWEYHDILFENQNALDVDSLKKYAADLGLDATKFDDCLDSGKYEQEVKKDFSDGQKAGVSGTPAFFINGRLLSGAQPFSAFKVIIDEELSGKAPVGTTVSTTGDMPKKDKAEVKLFVMSQCPYGTIAEKAMEPVVDLLGNKADIGLYFIANNNGDGTFRSLHGQPEVDGDIRQVCINKFYSNEVLFDYLVCVAEDYRNLDSIWEKCAEDNGIDVAKIKGCFEGDEGKDLLAENVKEAAKYGVTGSPTLIINDQKYSGSRTAEAFKQAICSGFTEEPDECLEILGTTGTAAAAPSGGCG